MFVRLTIADVKEGEINNALEYVKNTVIPSYAGLPGLLQMSFAQTSNCWVTRHLSYGFKIMCK